jgi:hypothetical protein
MKSWISRFVKDLTLLVEIDEANFKIILFHSLPTHIFQSRLNQGDNVFFCFTVVVGQFPNVINCKCQSESIEQKNNVSQCEHFF